MWLSFYLPVHEIVKPHWLRTIVECLGDIFFKEMMLLNVSKIIKEAALIVEKLSDSRAITHEHAAEIEDALTKFKSLFVGLSQLGCFASTEYKESCGITDKEFLGIPVVESVDGQPVGSQAFKKVPWTMTQTMELGRWLHAPWAIAMS